MPPPAHALAHALTLSNMRAALGSRTPSFSRALGLYRSSPPPPALACGGPQAVVHRDMHVCTACPTALVQVRIERVV
eukprot:6208811-Pleurochrysis_carterae.AAC.2